MHASSSPPALTLKQTRTRDFDEQATLLRGWNQHYAQLSPGPFKGAIVELLFDDVHLFLESTSHALYQSGKLDKDAIAVGIPLKTGQGGLFCGSPMDGRSTHLFSGDEGFEFYSPARLTMGGMVVSRRSLLEWLPGQPQQSFDRAAQLKEVSMELLHEAGGFLRTVFDLCHRSPNLLHSQAFRKQLRASVYACLADLVLEQGGAEHGLSPRRRWKLVQQARDYIDSMQDETLGIEDLCRELSVSRRTLQYCFQEILGLTPAAFIRARRLNKVRDLLKEVDSVTEAATAWGFWHFGHFSQEYKKLFGELPSDTLRRYHGPLPQT